MRDLRFPPRLKWSLPSCGKLRELRWFQTDVSRLLDPFGPWIWDRCVVPKRQYETSTLYKKLEDGKIREKHVRNIYEVKLEKKKCTSLICIVTSDILRYCVSYSKMWERKKFEKPKFVVWRYKFFSKNFIGVFLFWCWHLLLTRFLLKQCQLYKNCFCIFYVVIRSLCSYQNDHHQDVSRVQYKTRLSCEEHRSVMPFQLLLDPSNLTTYFSPPAPNSPPAPPRSHKMVCRRSCFYKPHNFIGLFNYFI